MTNREEFEKWWEFFKEEHEEWRFADKEALLLAAYQARQPEIDALKAEVATYRHTAQIRADRFTVMSRKALGLTEENAALKAENNKFAESNVELLKENTTLKAEVARLRKIVGVKVTRSSVIPTVDD